MTQVELVRSWLEGSNNGKVGSVSVKGDRLIHYSTVIAERHGDKVILNYTRYSLATGKVQKMLTDILPREDIVFISGIDAGFNGSLAELLYDDKPSPPEEWQVKIKHVRFGTGYVTSIDGNQATCVFSGKSKTLMWPDVIDLGLAEIQDDRR